MNGKTHHIVGLVLAESTLISLQQPALSLATCLGVMGGYFFAILPDIDDSDATISQHQPFRMASLILERLPFITHRGLTHSALVLGLLYFLFIHVLPIPAVVSWCMLIAYASHIVLDMFTAEGVELLYPFRLRVKFLPASFAVSSERSIVQWLLFGIGNILFIFLTIHLVIEMIQFVPVVGDLLNKIWFNVVLSHLPDHYQVWLLKQ